MIINSEQKPDTEDELINRTANLPRISTPSSLILHTVFNMI